MAEGRCTGHYILHTYFKMVQRGVIHLAHCGGSVLRDTIEEHVPDQIFVHHLNPKLWVKEGRPPEDKLIRYWKYGGGYRADNTKPITDLCDRLCTVVRDPYTRVRKEMGSSGIDHTDPLGHDIMCKSLLAAFTGDVKVYLEPFTESKYDTMWKHLNDTNTLVGVLDKYPQFITKLNEHFGVNFVADKFDRVPTQYPGDLRKTIEQYNKFDLLLYTKASAL